MKNVPFLLKLGGGGEVEKDIQTFLRYLNIVKMFAIQPIVAS